MPENIFGMLPALSKNLPVALISPFEPARTLVLHNGRPISQQQFLDDLHQVAIRLPSASFALNLCEDRYYFMLGFCALLIRGSVNLLPPNRHPATLLEVAQGYPDCYCLFDSDQPCELPRVNICDLLREPPQAVCDSELPSIPVQQTAAIAFTSGSTGKPTAVPKAWGSLAATGRMLGQKLTRDLSSPVIVATVPSQHMYGLEMTLMMALQAGAVMHSAKPFFPSDIQHLLANIRAPIVFVSAPVHLRALVSAELPMAALAKIISATAPLDRQIALEAEACFGADLFEVYGCTEAGSIAVRQSTQSDEWSVLDGFSLVVDGENSVAEAPHLEAPVVLQDEITIIERTQFLLHGRQADMINVGGKRTSLSALTLHLLRIDGVSDGVIFMPKMNSSQPHEPRPVALVVSDLSEKHIVTALAQRIDAVFLPRPLRKVGKLPRSETGKLSAAMLDDVWRQVNDGC